MIEFKEYEESLSAGTGPDLTPLIDMVFLLLIFFLLTSFLALPSIPVRLPETETAELHETPEPTVTLTAGGEIMLEDRVLTLEELGPALQAVFDARSTREVLIQADREVRFQRVVDVMDVSKKAGAENLSFLVEREQ
jgi:biopolymer transport protein ExbD